MLRSVSVISDHRVCDVALAIEGLCFDLARRAKEAPFPDVPSRIKNRLRAPGGSAA
jgi:hypothetical protein